MEDDFEGNVTEQLLDAAKAGGMIRSFGPFQDYEGELGAKD